MFEEQGYVYGYAQNNFMSKIYGWMCGALAITAATAWYVASSPTLFNRITDQPFLLLFIFIAQLGLVIALSALLNKMSYMTAIILFVVYAISLGITMSLMLRVYTLASIASTFIVTSGMFGGMALYGYFTQSNLSKMASILSMVVWGLVLALIVNLFFQSEWFDYVTSMVGVVIFALLTAADTQKLKNLGQSLFADKQTINKAALLGALMLYLDFINLFLFLLRFTGNRRSK